MVTLNAHYDRKTIVPDEPLALEPNQRLRITIEPIDSIDGSSSQPWSSYRALTASLAEASTTGAASLTDLVSRMRR